jgi:hypothetical protein
MALQKINWLQIDTEVVPSGSTINLGTITGSLNDGYFNNIYISGTSLSDFINSIPGIGGSSSGTSGTSGSSGTSPLGFTSGSSGTSGDAGGAVKIYQFTLSYSSNQMDMFPAGLVEATGPRGENLATLQALSWVFTRIDTQTVQVTRPSNLQNQPLVHICTHGINSGNVFTKSPTGVASTQFAAIQTYTGGKFTTLTLYGLNSTNTGISSYGPSNLIITFGLVS